MSDTHYLFSPGPVMVSDRVHSATLHPDICHRVPAFEKVIQNLQSNLLKVYKANDEYTVLLITGSGTAANEAVISSYLKSRQEALLINNGEFGCRLEDILDVHGIKKIVLGYEWGKKPDLSEIENSLKENPGISAVIMVHHETSTSMLNPVKEVGRLAHTYGKTFIVDAVSSLGGEDLDVVRDHIDFCTCSANKCIASLPGVGIVCAKISKIMEMKDRKPSTVYLNLYNLYQVSEKYHQTQNTPSTTMFYALNAAVQELLEEGVENRIARYKRCAGILREGIRDIGLKTLIDERDASNTVTSVFLPEEIDLNEFLNKMEERRYTVYPGKRHLREQNMFQVSNMGHVYEYECRKFLKTLRETINELKITYQLH